MYTQGTLKSAEKWRCTRVIRDLRDENARKLGTNNNIMATNDGSGLAYIMENSSLYYAKCVLFTRLAFGSVLIFKLWRFYARRLETGAATQGNGDDIIYGEKPTSAKLFLV